jgi:uncharacterized protein (TIGR03084 family)
MLEQASDFRDESEALYRLLSSLSDDDFNAPTQFKQWTPNDVLGHLHIWNWAADLSLNDEDSFPVFMKDVMRAVQVGDLRAFELEWRKGLSGKDLLEAWWGFCAPMSECFEKADPKERVKWVGPDMSVRSSITARLMETWAHGQALYDQVGALRQDSDRIQNIAILGVNTFGWAYKNRGLAIPDAVPLVRLTAPSGDTWEWNAENTMNCIEGSATEFCQVVTQVRNIADTTLDVSGETATQWMSIAQCFAGPSENPPTPGTRFTRRR